MTEQKQYISFLSLNVRGIRNKFKRSKLFTWINHQKSDIVILQETFLTSDIEAVIKIECCHYHCYFNHGTNHSKGVAILIRKKKSIEPLESLMQFEGRVIAVRIICGEFSYFVVNVYGPTKFNEKERFYKKLCKWLKNVKHINDTLVLGGDWNYVQDYKLDTRGISCVYKPVKSFKALKKHFDLIDVWRKRFPFRKQYTWRQLTMGIFSRLDYWLVSNALLSHVQTTKIKPIPICDHCAVTLKIMTSSNLRGGGTWKMNNSLLKDDNYKYNVKNVIKKFVLENTKLNAQKKWDMCKIKIKEYTIKYSKEKQGNRNQTFKHLQDEYVKISQETDKNSSEENLEKLAKIKKQIDEWLIYKCKGAFVRSRQNWMERGEKSTKYFLQTEKRNSKKKEINCIQKDGKCLTNQETILKEIVEFFKNLYSRNDKSHLYDFQTYLESTDIPVLSDDEAMLCEGLVTEEECREAVFSMKNNKSPGSDGLSSEFYKNFWDDVKFLVIESINEGFQKRELSESQRLAILTLLYKKGDKQCLENWRPISLLNTDYKILAKVLCKRLKYVIDKLISHEQTGYLKRRSAMQNLRLVQDIIEYCEHNDIPGILLFLDFKKAFDCIDHQFLFHVLHKFNFKESFIGWVRTIYTNAVGSVVNNGWVSQKFEVQRGIRQGCPLSALLFILVAEIMALKIKQNNDIHGITVSFNEINKQKEFKISQLADDTVLFVNSVESANVALKEVENFGKFAGPNLNIMKTNAVSIRPQNQYVNDLEWSEDPVKYLGIYLTRNKVLSEELNWFTKLEKVRSTLKYWKTRNLTIYGKIVILKSLIISQFVYVSSILPYPKKIIPQLNRLIYNFLWNSRREKVKRSVLLNPIEKGGLSMVDIQAKFHSINLSWLTNFVNCSSDAPWKFLFQYWIERIGPISLILRANCSNKDILNLCLKYKLPPFYVNCLLSWSNLKYIDFLDVDDIYEEQLWYNSNISINGKPLYFKEWYQKGIILIGDIFDNGHFKSRNDICKILNSNSLLIDFKYAKLKKAIPKTWVKRILEMNRNENTVKICDTDSYKIKTHAAIKLSNMQSKEFYNLLCDMKKSDVTVLAYWEERFNLTIDFDWGDILKFKFKKLKNNKVKQCYFKTLHRILPYRYNLYKWKIINDDLCKFCLKRESYRHALLDCPSVALFWKRVTEYIYSCFNEILLLNEKVLIIGNKFNQLNATDVNIVLTYAQYAIYKMYMLNYFQEKTYNSYTIWNCFKNELLLDKASCVISDTLKTFCLNNASSID